MSSWLCRASQLLRAHWPTLSYRSLVRALLWASQVAMGGKNLAWQYRRRRHGL